jgi:lysophospholipase L1-like esterase
MSDADTADGRRIVLFNEREALTSGQRRQVLLPTHAPPLHCPPPARARRRAGRAVGRGGAAEAGTTAKLNPPASINSMGDSITRGMNSGFFVGLQYTSLSWSTGDEADVNSHRTRLKTLRGGADPTDWNDAENGAKVSGLMTKAPDVVAHRPEYVTILVGANDVCGVGSDPANMTAVSTFRTRMQNALAYLTTNLPETRVFVATIPDVYRLWQVGKDSSTARGRWSLYNVCETLLAEPLSTAAADEARRQTVRQRVIDYNTQIAQVCAAFIHCRSDGGAAFNTQFLLEDLSGHDYFHPSRTGQAKAAATTWGATFDFTDKTAPATTLSLPAPPAPAVDGWYRSDVAVTASATDAAGVRGSEWARRTMPVTGNPAAWTRYDAPSR